MINVCVGVIYNHRFDNNIEKVENLYKGKFSNIWHIMPFYDGPKERVIPVYENSEVFQGYIAQAFSKMHEEDNTHYIFIADDLLLNPKINEHNILQVMGLDDDTAYIKKINNLTSSCFQEWPHALKGIGAFMGICYKSAYCHYSNELPSYEQAVKLFRRHNIEGFDLTLPNFLLKRDNISFAERIKNFIHRENERFAFQDQLCNCSIFRDLYLKVKKGVRVQLPYPLAVGYSDFFVIPARAIKMFIRLCGIFAAMGVFVEIAIPTAMLLSCKKIRYEQDISMKGIEMWDIPTQEKLSESYEGILENLKNDLIKSNTLYYHPIKLSQWK